eukprot:Lithocolla_globosa_v1_NODE_3630_length_1620_cov_25.512460.p3 type:complete len:125 gc:universal NODE_3630_length_1620_cov_25.512460:725-1099(+)
MLDLVVGAVRQVRDRPQSVSNNFFIVTLDEMGQERKTRRNNSPGRRRVFTPAQITQSPGTIAEQRQFRLGIGQQSHQIGQDVTLKNVVAAFSTISSNVTQGPSGLLLNVRVLGAQKLNKQRDGS